MSCVVLVVDDEPLVRLVAMDMLEDLGCEVVTASNSQEALERLACNPRIEVLLTDINMPGMNGCELAETAVQMHAGLKVIVLSGREIDCGGFPFIRKPFCQNDLKQMMARNIRLC